MWTKLQRISRFIFLPAALASCKASPDSSAATSSAATSSAATGSSEAPRALLGSAVYELGKLPVEKTDKGERRAVFEGQTATLDKLHAHITTLGPGLVSGEPRKHLQEEVIIVKEGTIEANFDGQARIAGPGSVIFFQSNAVTFLRNVGTTPATYYVVYYYTPLTPKG